MTTDTDVPDAPTGVNTALSTDELSVETTWSEPDDNGEAITSYTVYIQKKDGDFKDATGDCDEDAATILSDRKCTISMTTLRTGDYQLEYPDEVIAKVQAINNVGTSDDSTVSSGGALIQDVPTQMDAPT